MAIMDITKIQPSTVSLDPHDKTILLYGVPKSGKSTFASQIEDNLVIAFEPGMRLISGAKYIEVSSWADFKQVVRQLLTNPEAKEMYRSITVDTIGRAWDLAGAYVVSQGKTKDGMRAKKLADIPWGQGFALRDREFIDAFSNLQSAGYGLKYIAHSQEEQVKVDEKEIKTYYTPILPERPEVVNFLNGTIDLTMFIHHVKDAEGVSHRILVTREIDTDSINIYAGGRIPDLPVKIELSYPKFKEELQKAIEKSAKGHTTEHLEVPEVVEKRSFDSAMDEAKELFTKLDNNGKEKLQDIILKYMDNNPEKVRLSQFEPNDLERLELIIAEMRHL